MAPAHSHGVSELLCVVAPSVDGVSETGCVNSVQADGGNRYVEYGDDDDPLSGLRTFRHDTPSMDTMYIDEITLLAGLDWSKR